MPRLSVPAPAEHAPVSASQARALAPLPAERGPCGAQLLSNIPVYRWLCFAAMVVPAGYVAVLVVKALLWVLEDKYFLTSNVVFHIIAVRVRRCLLHEFLHHRMCQVVFGSMPFDLLAY